MSFWRNSLWRDASPTGAIKDFAQVWSSNPYRWRVLAAAMAMTAGLMYLAIPKSERAPPVRADITYISTFESGRTRAQIIASNLASQTAVDKLSADEKARAEYRKQFWESLGRATFVDVDAMKKQAARDEAAQERADAERAARNQARIDEQAHAAGK
jgi:hypothetical protein